MDGNALREGDTVQFVQVFDEKRGKMRAEDITGGITTDGYNAPRARFDDQVCFDFMKGRCGIRRLFLSRSRGLMDKASPFKGEDCGFESRWEPLQLEELWIKKTQKNAWRAPHSFF